MPDTIVNPEELAAITLEVFIGQKIGVLLNLKFDKAGRTKTQWGTKSVQGLGASILRIVKEEQERLKTIYA